MIPVEEARARILQAVAPLAGIEEVAVSACAGRVLTRKMEARRTQPPQDLSAMDGWALRAADAGDAGASLEVAGESAAGHGFAGTVGPGTAVRIFTGAPVPRGADCVIIQEDAQAAGGRVTFGAAGAAGDNIRKAGIDFTAGAPLLAAPRRLTARDAGLLAAAGIPWVGVAPRPRIAVIATGDELVRPGEPAGPAQIVNSNSIAVAALVAAAGGEPIDFAVVPDDLDAVRAALDAARRCDLIVTLGGASVGDHDLVRQALEGRGTLDFWKIAMRPGKPLVFGEAYGTPLIGLPGNPASAYLCAYLFLRPAIERLLGLDPGPDEARRRGYLGGGGLAANGPRQAYLRARLTGTAQGLCAHPLPSQDSSLLSELAAADGLIIRPPHAPAAAAGETIDLLVFRPGF